MFFRKKNSAVTAPQEAVSPNFAAKEALQDIRPAGAISNGEVVSAQGGKEQSPTSLVSDHQNQSNVPEDQPGQQLTSKERKHLHAAGMARRKVAKTTQNYLDIVGMRNSTVVMRDGTLRAILMVSSVNFALKSADEQNSIVYAYQGLLNSLNFPIQFVIQSRELNIEPYLKGLEELEKKQTNELLRVQTIEYREFIGELVEWGQIMRKRFYVVIPYSVVEAKEEGLASKFQNLFRPAEVIRQSEKNFLKFKGLLDQRAARMEGLLNAVGLKSVRLNTQELIELFYNVYNPLVAHTQPLTDIHELNVI